MIIYSLNVGVPKLPARIVLTQIPIRFFYRNIKCDIKTIELLELYNLYIKNRFKKKKIDGIKKIYIYSKVYR